MTADDEVSRRKKDAILKYTKTKEYLLSRAMGLKNIQIEKHILILDTTKFINSCVKVIESNEVLSRPFVIFYLKLHELRHYFLKLDEKLNK